MHHLLGIQAGITPTYQSNVVTEKSRLCQRRINRPYISSKIEFAQLLSLIP